MTYRYPDNIEPLDDHHPLTGATHQGFGRGKVWSIHKTSSCWIARGSGGGVERAYTLSQLAEKIDG